MNKGINIKCSRLEIMKQVFITQILSIIFAIVGELYIRVLITYDWMFINFLGLILGMILLTIFYIILVRLFLQGNWFNIPLISIPYIIYWFIILFQGSKMFPTNTDPNDYGVGIMILFMSIYEWISVIAASFIGTYLRKRK